MRTVGAIALLTLVARADLQWDFDGYPRILAAAKAAQARKKRILVGMSGAPT